MAALFMPFTSHNPNVVQMFNQDVTKLRAARGREPSHIGPAVQRIVIGKGHLDGEHFNLIRTDVVELNQMTTGELLLLIVVYVPHTQRASVCGHYPWCRA